MVRKVLGSVLEEQGTKVSSISVANKGSSVPDDEVGVEQVYVLNGMNKCLMDHLLPVGNGHVRDGEPATAYL